MRIQGRLTLNSRRPHILHRNRPHNPHRSRLHNPHHSHLHMFVNSNICTETLMPPHPPA